ncbi:MAG: hypothetical protein ABIH42_10375 [Planctomycetota bacterium]
MRITKTHIIIVFVAVIGAYCLFYTLRDMLSSEENKIKRIFSSIAEEVESRAVFGATKYLSTDFRLEHDFSGFESISYATVKRMLLVFYKNFESPIVKIESISVELKGDNMALVEFAGYLADKKQPGRAYYSGNATLKKIDNEWLITNAKIMKRELQQK